MCPGTPYAEGDRRGHRTGPAPATEPGLFCVCCRERPLCRSAGADMRSWRWNRVRRGGTPRRAFPTALLLLLLLLSKPRTRTCATAVAAAVVENRKGGCVLLLLLLLTRLEKGPCAATTAAGGVVTEALLVPGTPARCLRRGDTASVGQIRRKITGCRAVRRQERGRRCRRRRTGRRPSAGSGRRGCSCPV